MGARNARRFSDRKEFMDLISKLDEEQFAHLGENAEVIPGFTTIPCDGIIQRCTAYCDRYAKRNGLPINNWATTLWHMALKREGYDRGLRREDGTIADWLNGSVVVVCTGKPLEPK